MQRCYVHFRAIARQFVINEGWNTKRFLFFDALVNELAVARLKDVQIQILARINDQIQREQWQRLFHSAKRYGFSIEPTFYGRLISHRRTKKIRKTSEWIRSTDHVTALFFRYCYVYGTT